jgi:periplasmic protein TonB
MMRMLMIVALFLLACAALGRTVQDGRVVQQNPEAKKPTRVRISPKVAAQLIQEQVSPQPVAKGGFVVLKVVVGRDGYVRDVTRVRGDEAIAESAIQAVRQWKYKPYFLNGEAVEVETEITVDVPAAKPGE